MKWPQIQVGSKFLVFIELTVTSSLDWKTPREGLVVAQMSFFCAAPPGCNCGLVAGLHPVLVCKCAGHSCVCQCSYMPVYVMEARVQAQLSFFGEGGYLHHCF